MDIMTSIHNPGDYEVRVDCSKNVFIGEGRCEVSPGRYMEVKVTKKNALPGQGGSKTRVYKVTAHNNNSAYICDKKGAIKRGYAATFEDFLYGEVEYMADVCTTVAVVGQTDTRSTIVVTEKKSGLYIKFENAGQHWKSVGSFPDESKDVAVNFDEVRKG
ncbi:hypothetical protein [Shewanella surugensis]|uniref:Uncharacterized protein n=1 Tax=Shewanella surugensis TaxID=212020 RepID=A0ABT0LBG3_9GAMM|nr:hypothetical protein [Shewanella surugensis]MCL1125033.1 hypothetical protein [Shewanella surugensis]